MDKFTITLSLCTRVKRKIFNDDSVCNYFIKKANAVALEEDVVITDIRFRRGYIVILSCSIPIGLHPEKLASRIRGSTSASIRNEFPAFNKMPSFWKKQVWWKAGTFSDGMLSEIIEYWS